MRVCSLCGNVASLCCGQTALLFGNVMLCACGNLASLCCGQSAFLIGIVVLCACGMDGRSGPRTSLIFLCSGVQGDGWVLRHSRCNRSSRAGVHACSGRVGVFATVAVAVASMRPACSTWPRKLAAIVFSARFQARFLDPRKRLKTF